MEPLPLLLAIMPFAVVNGFTPGPNNFMLAASGANFGLRRTVPHIAGVVLGFTFLAFVVSLGLGGVMARSPLLHLVLKYAGAAFLLYLAWRIATATPHPEKAQERRGRPLTFIEAALFQWVNPKAWLIVVGGIATYTSVDGDMLMEVSIFVGDLFLAALPAAIAWAALGAGINRLLGANPKALRIFNITMALLLVASIVPFFT
jgi:threonine/homoserine/homoserine lactone efflux protein